MKANEVDWWIAQLRGALVLLPLGALGVWLLRQAFRSTVPEGKPTSSAPSIPWRWVALLLFLAWAVYVLHRRVRRLER